MANLFPEFNEAKWEQIRTHPYYAQAVAAITAETEEMLKTEPPRIKFSELHLFVVNGDRQVFGQVINSYVLRLNNYFFMYCLTKEEKYLNALSDIIWNICDFESWSIPAHVSEELSPYMRRVNLDLCSTVMGFRLAEILHYIGDKLPDLVRRRAEYEVRDRIIESYKKNNYWWMDCTNNWSAVCAACVLAAYLYLAEKEEIDEQLPRLIETIRCYLRGINDDGCCLEGYGYWQYGFSHFCLFATLLRAYTDGAVNLFDDPKVHAIAHFQENIKINQSDIISFSDSHPGAFSPVDWLSHFLKREYPDLVPPTFTASTAKNGVLRYWLWADPDAANVQQELKSMIFAESQWYIYRSKTYNFACKGGSNDEPHNHNDIGSFIISKNEQVTFNDPGTGEYTRQYFSSERYHILEPSSRAHSVPIINGQYQVTGSQKSTVYHAEHGHYCYSLENGYNVASLDLLTREFCCEADAIHMNDTYRFSEKPQSIVERFVSLILPQITAEGVQCGNSLLEFDPNVFTVAIRSEKRICGGKETETVYFVDLTVKEPQENLTVSVTFR